jgi:hypothetical protein
LESDNFPTVAAGGDNISHILLDDTVKPEYRLKMIPIQLHMHVPSEHTWDGMMVRTPAAQRQRAASALTACMPAPLLTMLHSPVWIHHGSFEPSVQWATLHF